MRLFVAVQPSEEFRKALSVLQYRLQASGITARYLDPSNFHLTLAFIGEWPENIAGILPAVEKPFILKLSHAGIFPEAKVLWAGVAPSDALNQLAASVRNALSEAGIPFDPKPFVPHITLGRKPAVPEGTGLADISVPPAAMTVSEACVYRSEHRENGMVYTVIGRGSEGKPDENNPGSSAEE